MLSFLKLWRVTPTPLIPRVRPLGWFESYAYNTLETVEYLNAETFFDTHAAFYMHYDSDLAIGFCDEQERAIDVVSFADMKDYGKKPENILRSAKNNLYKIKPMFQEIHEGVYITKDDNNCASGVMLLKDEILQLPLKSPPVVFFYSRDIILLTGAEDHFGLNYCMDMILQSVQDGESPFLTTDAYMLDQGTWNKIGIKGTTDVIKRYQKLAYEERERVFYDLSIQLEVLYPDDDLFIAQYNALETKSNIESFSCWLEFPRVWIPRVDKILIGTDPGRPPSDKDIDEACLNKIFDWQTVEHVLGNRMQRLPLYNEIWEFNGFPTPEEIKLLQTYQTKMSNKDA